MNMLLVVLLAWALCKSDVGGSLVKGVGVVMTEVSLSGHQDVFEKIAIAVTVILLTVFSGFIWVSDIKQIQV